MYCIVSVIGHLSKINFFREMLRNGIFNRLSKNAKRKKNFLVILGPYLYKISDVPVNTTLTFRRWTESAVPKCRWRAASDNFGGVEVGHDRSAAGRLNSYITELVMRQRRYFVPPSRGLNVASRRRRRRVAGVSFENQQGPVHG